ncbi:MAG TPA: hypothetical protein VJT73_13650 [Polyangiaceae bacterium]|nr:hypothetical protein [Polyangiaceae bacterium]
MTASPLSPERLFERYFWPLYPEEARRDLTAARQTDANPAKNPSVSRSLDEIADTFATMAPHALGRATLELDDSDASVHRLSAAIDRGHRDRWMNEIAPDGAPILSHFVVHGAVYVGRCAVRNHEGRWLMRRPLWESLVRLRSAAGEGDLAIFHWWLKSLSDAEIDRHTLSDRYRAHVEEPRFRPETMAPIIAEPRRIPRLAKVRYDTLHKHLAAHLPEMKDLGRDFPSAARFAELGFRHLDFVWLGGTRMLLAFGPAKDGVHLFWLDRAGFVKAAFYPGARADCEVKLEGDTLEIAVVSGGVRSESVVLWWGP